MSAFFAVPEVEVLRMTPERELPPILVERVSAMLASLAIGPVSPELLQDAYSYVSGGDMVAQEQLERAVRYKIGLKLPWYWRVLYWLMPGAHQAIYERNLLVWRFLKLFPRDAVPGSEEEQQMVALIALLVLTAQLVQTRGCQLMDVIEAIADTARLLVGLNEDERTLLEAFPSLSKVNELPELLQRQFDESKVDPETFFLGEDLVVERLLGERILARREREEQLSKDKSAPPPEEFRVRELLAVEQLLLERGKIILLRMYRRIKDYRSFAHIRVKKFVPDSNGLELRLRRMKSLSEFPKLRKSELTLLVQRPTLFWLRMLQNQGTVRERGRSVETKRIVYILVDRSVSMLFNGSMFKAGGVIFTRLLAVLADNASVFVRFFDGDVQPVMRADDPADSQLMMGKISRVHFVGTGGTDITNAIRAGIRDIRKLAGEENLEHPQILIVTDGRGDVAVDPSECRGIELHAFVCKGKNPALRKLVHELGGLILEEL